MKKIAILYMCTGQYLKLWPGFFESAEKYLLKQSEVHYFVFTDADHLDGEEKNPCVHRIFQKPEPWPYTTLKRFDIFLRIEDELKAFDYIYFFNANCEFRVPITEEMILPRREKHEKMVFVLHPCFFTWYNFQFPYDRNPHSKAFIPMGLGREYVCGGINGGESKAYLKFCHTLQKRIQKDCDHGVMALWHDESHINWYAMAHPGYRLLDSSYAYFESFPLDIPIYIFIRAKSHYFDVDTFKKDPPKSQLTPREEKFNEMSAKLAHKIQRRMPWLPRRLNK